MVVVLLFMALPWITFHRINNILRLIVVYKLLVYTASLKCYKAFYMVNSSSMLKESTVLLFYQLPPVLTSSGSSISEVSL